jgi:HEPN domain-containing protein
MDSSPRHARIWNSSVGALALITASLPENAAKAGLALIGPVGRTHTPSILLRRLMADGHFVGSLRPRAERLAECAELLGPDLHPSSDYGDEHSGRTPWELFGEEDAQNAVSIAGDAVATAYALVREAGVRPDLS